MTTNILRIPKELFSTLSSRPFYAEQTTMWHVTVISSTAARPIFAVLLYVLIRYCLCMCHTHLHRSALDAKQLSSVMFYPFTDNGLVCLIQSWIGIGQVRVKSKVVQDHVDNDWHRTVHQGGVWHGNERCGGSGHNGRCRVVHVYCSGDSRGFATCKSIQAQKKRINSSTSWVSDNLHV